MCLKDSLNQYCKSDMQVKANWMQIQTKEQTNKNKYEIIQIPNLPSITYPHIISTWVLLNRLTMLSMLSGQANKYCVRVVVMCIMVLAYV